MAAKLTRPTYKIAIQLHLVTGLCHLQFSLQAASRKLLDTPSYMGVDVRIMLEWILEE
jgi:hypothetical protein